jgi:hypothetical protein
MAYKPSEIDLQTCLISNYDGKWVELRELVLEFNVYHDLLSPGIKCDIIVNDGVGLIEKVPLVGDETIILEFKDGSADSTKLTYCFSLYKISDRVQQQDRTSTYTIHGISQEVIKNMRSSIGRSYTDMTGKQIITGVYESYLKPKLDEFKYIKKSKSLIIDDTIGNHSFVVAKKTPLTFINMLQKEIEDAKYKSSAFLFYENVDGWRFKTVDSLIDKEPVDDFYFTSAINDDRNTKKSEDNIKDYQIISNIDYYSQFDVVDNHATGLLDNTVMTVDPIRKVFNSDTFIYNNDFKQIKHLEKHKIYTEESLYRKNNGQSTTSYIVSQHGQQYDKLPYISNGKANDHFVRNPRRLHKFLKFMLPTFSQLNNIILNIIIPGNSTLNVGEIINVHIPQQSADLDHMTKDNLLFGNKFLITAIRHTYNKIDNRYSTVIQVVKDTYAKNPVEVE